MKVLTVYARIYADCLVQSLRGIRRNLWTLLLPMVLPLLLTLAATLLAPMGLVGGFAVGFFASALLGCYLYFLGLIVGKAKTSVREWKQSLLTHLWSVVNVGFVLWIADLVVRTVLELNPRLGFLSFFQFLLVLILLNATPEVIYQRGTSGGLETLQRAYQFVQESWIEWLIPNLLILAGLYFLYPLLWQLLGAVPFLPGILFGALIHGLMVFRGFLFATLDGTSHRQRMFKLRTTA
jgi:hypothetical protein